MGVVKQIDIKNWTCYFYKDNRYQTVWFNLVKIRQKII